MKYKTLQNLQLNLLVTLVTGVLNFILNKYFAKYMGTNMLGLMKLFTQMIAYLSLVDLGIGSASAYALYKPLAEKDINKISLVVSTIDSFYKKIAFYILILGSALSFVVPYFIKLELYDKKIYIYWILYVINTSIGYLFAKYSILFIANQEYGFVRKVQGIGKIIFQIIQIISLVKMQSFVLFIIIMILENSYNYILFYKHYRKSYIYIKKVKEKDHRIIKDMKSLFWHKIGTLVVFNTDYIVLSKFISLSVVGIYSSYIIVYQMIMTLINILTPVLIPNIGSFVSQNNKEKIYIYWRELYSVYIFLGTIFVICTYFLIVPFVNLWLGKEFILSNLTITLILINLFIDLIRGVTDIFKTSCGFFDDIYTPVLESVINLLFSIILVKKMGLNGVILGTLISNVIAILLLKPILVFKKCFDKNGFEYIIDTIKLLLRSSIGIILMWLFINLSKIKLEFIQTWKELILKSFILGIMTTIVIFVMFIKDYYFKKIVKKFFKKFFI